MKLPNNALFLALSEEMTFSDKGVFQSHRTSLEIFAQFKKEIPEPDSGGMIHFETPADIEWSIEGNALNLSFSLQKGEFATSLIREVVDC